MSDKAELLAIMDNAKLSWFHIKIIIIAGMGFFTDAYDLFCISLLTKIIGRVYYQDNPYSLDTKVDPGKLPIQLDISVSAVALCGTLFGQFFFGSIADILGRKAVYGIVLVIMVVGAFCQSMSFGTSSNAVIGSLCFWRFLLGVGVGGDYPLSATIMSEYSNRNNRGALVGAIFAMQGLGILTAAAVVAIVTACFQAAYPPKAYPLYGPLKVNTVGKIGAIDWVPNGPNYDAFVLQYPTYTGAIPLNHATPNMGAWQYCVDGAGGANLYTGSAGYIYSGTATGNAFCALFATINYVGNFGPIYGFNADASKKGKRYTTSLEKQLYYQSILDSCRPEYDFVWRVVLACGCIPAVVTMYLRSKMPETPRYTLHVTGAAGKAESDMANVVPDAGAVYSKDTVSTEEVAVEEDLTRGEFLRKYGSILLGTAMAWCFLDVAFYSQGLFQKDVFLQIGWLPPDKYMNALEITAKTARAQAIIALGSTIPGYWFTVFFVDIIGRKILQFVGFLLMTALMSALAGSYHQILNPNNNDINGLNPNQPDNRNGWIAMYAFCFFFANFGPNATTFIMPAELFPTKWKATGHGISAAAGKAGAILGSFGFLYASQPARLELTWKYPCNDITNIYPSGSSVVWSTTNTVGNPIFTTTYPAVYPGGACKIYNNCPTGRYYLGNDYYPTIVDYFNGRGPDAILTATACDICKPNVLSGCYGYGIGVAGALGILAATNFLGMCFTLLVPETNGKTLEELSLVTSVFYSPESGKLIEK